MQITRLEKFFGGIVNGERNRTNGVAFNVEEIDIFKNPDYIEPTTIFGNESAASAQRHIYAYALSEADDLYLYQGAADGDAQIQRLQTASVDDPGSWSGFFESTSDLHPNTDMEWHKWASGADYLYYLTLLGSTVTLRSLGDLTSASESSVGTMTGLDGTGDRVQMIRGFGELYITNGNYIAKVDDSGNYTDKAFTLPTDLTAVSMDLRGDTMWILCKYVSAGINKCRIVVWDLTSTSQPTEQIDIPMSGPQWIVNHAEVMRVFCSNNGIGRFYEVPGLVPLKTHELENLQVETAAQPVSPVQAVFINENVLYFSLWKTDKSGLYALGKVTEGAPLALILAKRFDTSDYSLHTPYAATVVGPNWYCAFADNGSSDSRRIEGNNSPTRSSNAVYESVLLDVNQPESIKDWRGYIAIAKPIPASCEIKIDAKVDNASSYDSNSLVTLTSSNDYVHDGGTADTYWHRLTTSLAGRFLRLRIRFTSSTTTKPTLYSVSVLSDNRPII